MLPATVVLVIWLNIFPSLSHTSSLNLSSLSWSVINGNSSINISAVVPGGIYTDLLREGVLPNDIFYRFNDQDYRWVAKDNWTYSTTFNVDPNLLKRKNVFLEFEGLDTVSKVLLNGRVIGETENMFVFYRYNVQNLLQEFNNRLEVVLLSPVLAAQQAADQSLYPVPPSCTPSVQRGECHVNYLRKMQASFSWDWGPAFPSLGIWKDVVLRAYDVAYARHVAVETKPDEADWKVSATLYLDVGLPITGTLSAFLELNNTHKVAKKLQVAISPQKNNPSLVLSVPKNSVQLWWPNGHGAQPLYRLTVAFISKNDVTHKVINIGFRTISLDQMEVVPGQPEKGLSFYFRVNGVPIFMKGSNYIPAHILPEMSADPIRVRHLLISARDANMNMLRVWGGGLYESDLFYQICDELGLLIWQDLMFACSMYPTDPKFLASVAEEVTQQVLRLQHHPCIALWAGNNENELALVQNWYGTSSNFSLYKSDYIKLYVDTIKPIMQQLDKTRSYVTSSPSNGLETEKEGYVANNPGDPRFGDVHFYNYLNNLWNPVIFPKTRFASEFGVMALPSLGSFANISSEEDLNLDSKFMKSRQHHSGGYNEMALQITSNLYLPKNFELDTFIYLSQINQAMSIKTEVESYRQGRNRIDAAGKGYTMGALYWQLNDVWQAPSWSSIEYSGKWKMLHHFAVDFFAPVLVSPSKDIKNDLHVFVISDLKLHMATKLLMRLSVYKWNSLVPLFVQQYPFTMIGAGVVEVGSWNIVQFLNSIEGCSSGGDPEKNCFFHFSILANNASDTLGPDNFFFPAPLHSVNSASKANVQIVGIKSLKSNSEFIITVSTNVIAPFVWLESGEVSGQFSHNGFLMVTNQTQLTFTAQQPITVELIRSALSVRSLVMH